MKKLVLHAKNTFSQIHVPVDFVDVYMPEASGDALKVYLYLLRASQDPAMILSLQDMVDLFDVTANKILQALRYWESQGLLSLSFDGEELTDITLLSGEIAPVSTGVAASEPDTREVSAPAAKSAVKAAPSYAEAPTEGPVDFDALYRDEAYIELLGISEIYFGRTLSEKERRSLADCYLLLGRRMDLTEYLLEYCIERNHASLPYMRTVAEGWNAKGFSTLEEIKASANIRNTTVYSIMKALGIKGRDPVRQEEDYILSWSRDFELPLILEACNRTMSNLHNADFNYVNGILNNWRTSGVRTLQDVAELDVLHEDNRKRSQSQNTVSRGAAAFNNVPQRGTDYDALFANYYQR